MGSRRKRQHERSLAALESINTVVRSSHRTGPTPSVAAQQSDAAAQGPVPERLTGPHGRIAPTSRSTGPHAALARSAGMTSSSNGVPTRNTGPHGAVSGTGPHAKVGPAKPKKKELVTRQKEDGTYEMVYETVDETLPVDPEVDEEESVPSFFQNRKVLIGAIVALVAVIGAGGAAAYMLSKDNTRKISAQPAPEEDDERAAREPSKKAKERYEYVPPANRPKPIGDDEPVDDGSEDTNALNRPAPSVKEPSPQVTPTANRPIPTEPPSKDQFRPSIPSPDLLSPRSKIPLRTDLKRGPALRTPENLRKSIVNLKNDDEPVDGENEDNLDKENEDSPNEEGFEGQENEGDNEGNGENNFEDDGEPDPNDGPPPEEDFRDDENGDNPQDDDAPREGEEGYVDDDGNILRE